MTTVTFAIGDVHGCSRELNVLLEKIYDSIASQEIADWRIILVGDYVDRGPNVPAVIERLMKEESHHGKDRFVCLMGNHDECVVNGETFLSATTRSQYPDGKIDPDHIAWLRDLRDIFVDEHRIYVHAGLARGVHIADQSREHKLWLRGGEHYWHGKTVVCGHVAHGEAGPKITFDKELDVVTCINVDNGCCFGGRLLAAVFDEKRYLGFMCVDSGFNSNQFVPVMSNIGG